MIGWTNNCCCEGFGLWFLWEQYPSFRIDIELPGRSLFAQRMHCRILWRRLHLTESVPRLRYSKRRGPASWAQMAGPRTAPNAPAQTVPHDGKVRAIAGLFVIIYLRFLSVLLCLWRN